jgi:3-hydroxyisobutyrate dehydrogenase
MMSKTIVSGQRKVLCPEMISARIHCEGGRVVKIGWIGTGVMGRSMAGHLQDSGHELYVYNRTKTKADSLLDKGAHWCDSPAAAAQDPEIVFTMVGFPADVEQTYFGPGGLLSAKGACRILVDMTTTEPSLARRIAQTASNEGLESLDAPVSGGDVGARNASLAIMVGGDKAVYDEVFPLFQVMGRNIAYMGLSGSGQHTKMCNQILVSGLMISVCESLLYAAKAELDPQAVIDIVSQGAAASWTITNLGPRILAGDYNPGFYVEHFIKDMGIALKEAATMNLSLPGLALVHQLYLAVKAEGHGRLGTQALMLALKKLNSK